MKGSVNSVNTAMRDAMVRADANRLFIRRESTDPVQDNHREYSPERERALQIKEGRKRAKTEGA